MKARMSLLVALSATMLACTSSETHDWVPVGGSRSDGIVVLGIAVPPKFGVRETAVQWDAEQANAEANRLCRNWGYNGAETFNTKLPVQLICHPVGISPCWSKTYKLIYQCLATNRPELR